MELINPAGAPAYVLGDNIDTDQIFPGKYLELTGTDEIRAHCLEGCDPALAARFENGGVLVAGTNFGCGSSREHAAIAIKAMGASVVIADSFARIFYRNAINLALPLLVCPGIRGVVSDGDVITADLSSGVITNITSGETITGQPVSEYAMSILRGGGIKPLMLERTKANG